MHSGRWPLAGFPGVVHDRERASTHAAVSRRRGEMERSGMPWDASAGREKRLKTLKPALRPVSHLALTGEGEINVNMSICDLGH